MGDFDGVGDLLQGALVVMMELRQSGIGCDRTWNHDDTFRLFQISDSDKNGSQQVSYSTWKVINRDPH